MTLITMTDGKVVMRDGQVGTEQACCCDVPCDCDPSQLYVIPSSCGIDYLALNLDFLFADCGHDAVSYTALIDPASTLFDYTFADSLGCDWQVTGNINCVGTRYTLSFTLASTSGADGGQCCYTVCDVDSPPQFGFHNCGDGVIGSWVWGTLCLNNRLRSFSAIATFPQSKQGESCCVSSIDELVWGDGVCAGGSLTASLSVILL